jgi:peptidoglycan/LPS O-acetylase OafA/YrhL
MASPDDRLPAIDLVRLVSILAVFAVHLHASGLARPPHTSIVREAWVHFARNGSYGVTLFFVVSGFVITRTILRRDSDFARVDLRGFYARRAGRILPLLALVIVLGVAALRGFPGDSARIAFCLRDPKAQFDAAFWLSLPTLSFNWLRIAREHVSYGFGLHWDVLWSLAIEEQFYLGYPLALRILKHRARVVAALSCVVFTGPVARALAAQIDPRSFLLAFTNSFAAFDLIAMGALLCLFLDEHSIPANGFVGRLEDSLGLLGVVGMVATYSLSTLDRPGDRVWGPTALGASLCLTLAVAIRRKWLSVLPARALTAPGQFSYGAYLFHPMTLFILWPMLVGRHVLLAFILYAAVTLCLAWVAYRRYEIPANRAVRRRLGAV